jgi:hypothetical protein
MPYDRASTVQDVYDAMIAPMSADERRELVRMICIGITDDDRFAAANEAEGTVDVTIEEYPGRRLLRTDRRRTPRGTDGE